jgi:hypothetical protein
MEVAELTKLIKTRRSIRLYQDRPCAGSSPDAGY